MIAIFYIQHCDGQIQKANICVHGSRTFYALLEKYIRDYKCGYVKNENGETIFKWGWNE